MAHFAKVVNGKVINVIKAELDFFDTFIDDSPGDWIQTSYNTKGGIHYDSETNEPDGGEALRYNYAFINCHYDEDTDAFYSPKPYSSWTLNTETYLWEAPVAYPDADSDERYEWNEENQSWDLVETE